MNYARLVNVSVLSMHKYIYNKRKGSAHSPNVDITCVQFIYFIAIRKTRLI